MIENPKRQGGFTLVESIITLVVVGILAAVATPLFFSLSTYNQKFYQDEVVNTIRYARKLAVASGYSIQVSVTEASISLQQRTEGSSCTIGTRFSDIVDPLSNVVGYVRTAPTHTTLNFSSQWPIYFNRLGQALRASDCQIGTSLISIGVDDQSSFSIYPETGFIE